jgi:O-antigen/teichoic acid export membrane protein
VRSAFYSIMQRFSLTFFGFVNLALLFRMLSKPQMGVWALFLTITGIFELTKSNLLKNAHIKYVSSSNDPKERTTIASSSFLINLSMTIFFILLIIFFSDWLSRWLTRGLELSAMLKWFIPGIVFMIFFSHLEATQQSHLDFKGVFAGYFIRQLTFFIVIISYRILHVPLSLTHLVLYQALSMAIGAIVLFLFTKKYLLFRFSASKLWVRKITGYGGYILGSGVVANVFSNLDQIMASKFINPTAVAYYNAANRINGLIDIPSYAAADIIFPKTSRASVEEGKERVKYLFERMVAVLLAFTIPTALFIIIFAHLIMVIVAGKDYNMAVPVLQLYMITGIFRPVQNQAANLLNSIGKPRLVFMINTITLMALLLINYVCLLQFGFYGIAIGSMITTILSFIIWYFIMRKEINLQMSKVFSYSIDTYKNIYREAIAMFSKTKNKPVDPLEKE